MGRSRSLRRESNGDRSVPVYPVDTTLGWRVISHVTKAHASEKMARGEWREVHDEHGNFWGCQMLANFKKDEDLPSGASSTSITVNECFLNAGLGGKSRTARMTEDERLSRKDGFGHPLPPEDAVERAQTKVAEFGRGRLVATPRGPIELPNQGNWDQYPYFGRLDKSGLPGEPTEENDAEPLEAAIVALEAEG